MERFSEEAVLLRQKGEALNGLALIIQHETGLPIAALTECACDTSAIVDHRDKIWGESPNAGIDGWDNPLIAGLVVTNIPPDLLMISDTDRKRLDRYIREITEGVGISDENFAKLQELIAASVEEHLPSVMAAATAKNSELGDERAVFGTPSITLD